MTLKWNGRRAIPQKGALDGMNVEVAEANLAKDLADRMKLTFSRERNLGFVSVDRSIPAGTLVRAMKLFQQFYPNVRPVFSAMPGTHQYDGRFNFVDERH
jgi:hypothetical protein